MQACDVSSESELHGDDLDLPQGLAINVHPHEIPNRLEHAEIPKVIYTKWWDLFYAPVLVCKEPKVTVGLGDAISASALSAHYPNDVHRNAGCHTRSCRVCECV